MIRPAVVVLAAAVLAAGDAATGRWARIATGAVRETITVPAGLRAQRASMLAARIGGRVAEVLVDVGDRVEAGQPLIRLDPAAAEATLASRRAEHAASRARAEAAAAAVPAAAAAVAAAAAEALTAEHERARRETLRARGEAVSEQELEKAATAAAVAAARLAVDRATAAQATARLAELRCAVEAAAAGLRLAEIDLAETTVRAPYAGVVARRLVDPGVVVASPPVTDLIEVQEADRLWLEYSLPQEVAAGVGPGSPLRWRVEGAGEGEAVVAAAWPVLDPATRSLRLRTALTGGRLRPGQLATVTVVVREVAAAVVAPRPALRRNGDAWIATARDGDRAVRIGIVDGDRVEVLDGLKPGDEVRLP